MRPTQGADRSARGHLPKCDDARNNVSSVTRPCLGIENQETDLRTNCCPSDRPSQLEMAPPNGNSKKYRPDVRKGGYSKQIEAIDAHLAGLRPKYPHVEVLAGGVKGSAGFEA